MKFNVWTVISGLFIIYIGNSLWHLYLLYFPALCVQKFDSNGKSTGGSTKNCLEPAINPMIKNVQLRLYYSLNGRSVDFENSEILKIDSFNLSKEFTEQIQIRLPLKTRKNGTLWVHAFLMPKDDSQTAGPNSGSPLKDPRQASWHVERKSLVTDYIYPIPDTINLLRKDGDNEKMAEKSSDDPKNYTTDKTVAHLRSVLPLIGIGEELLFDWNKIPNEIARFLQLNERRRYLPIFSIDELSFRFRDLVRIKDDQASDSANLTVKYKPVSVGKLRLLVTAQKSTETLKNLGFTEKDIDEVKGIFTDTNFYFLALTFAVAAVHILLDFLAFKNDINFWRGRKTMVGLSTKTLLWRCFSQIVVFFYLLDESTSLLVLIPTALGALIEIWKLTKAFKMSLSFSGGWLRLNFGERNTREQETDSFDSQGMKYLAYLLSPLCLCGAVYSLLYTPHKSWYSWFIQSLANAVYAFGFLFMLPQLFINYKLKSVAHLPWRAFMYKAFNTFIDDMFAFIITMPAAHRVACFRDDVVFVIYLYQRYLYPVDKKRVNEFGESFEDDEAARKKKD